jgi:hypothetical protein
MYMQGGDALHVLAVVDLEAVAQNVRHFKVGLPYQEKNHGRPSFLPDRVLRKGSLIRCLALLEMNECHSNSNSNSSSAWNAPRPRRMSMRRTNQSIRRPAHRSSVVVCLARDGQDAAGRLTSTILLLSLVGDSSHQM